MNIAIFGAGGATGRLLTQRSLAAGYNVTALLRTTPQSSFSGNVRVVYGSAFDHAPVLETVEGADVVLSALGARSPLRNENVLPRAVPFIVDAMRQSGVRRIIVLGSAGALPDSLDKQPAWRRWIIQEIVYKSFLKWPVR